MLLTVEVDVEWTPGNRKHYESKGYIFTKYTGKLTVKAKDLAKSSTKIVEVKCDYCGKEITKVFQDYTRGKERGNGKDCCKKCAILKHKETVLDKYGVDNINQAFGLGRKFGDKTRTDSSLVLQEFDRQGLIPIDFNYINCNTAIKFICSKHPEYGIQTTSYRSMRTAKCSCKACFGENEREENHPYWRGGVSTLENYLKRRISKWKKDSIKSCDGKCVITGERSNLVHHLYGFSNILKETMDEIKIPIRFSISDYTSDELDLITKRVLENHYKYPLGVCLTKDIHFLFHHHYGYGNNTPEQFYEFQENYHNGIYKEVS